MKDKLPKRYIVLYFSIALLLISITISGSFAFYTAVVNGGSTPTEITTAKLSMKFENSEYINADDLIILSNDEIEAKSQKSIFDVVNDSEATGYYDLYFDTTLTNNLISDDFKWELVVDGVVVNNGSFVTLTKDLNNTTSTGSIKLTSSPIQLSSTNSNHCILKIWLQETSANQIELTEGTMSGHARLIAVTK